MLPARPTESVGADRPLILEIVRERERTGTRSSLAHWPVGSAAKRVESAPALGCSGRSGGLPAHELTNRVTAYSHSTLLASHHDLALNPLAHFRIFSSRPPGTDRNPSSSIARPGRDLDGSHQLSDAESRPSHDTSRKHNKTQNSRVCISQVPGVLRAIAASPATCENKHCPNCVNSWTANLRWSRDPPPLRRSPILPHLASSHTPPGAVPSGRHHLRLVSIAENVSVIYK